MSGSSIIFEDGAAYERMMGVWSRLAGDEFLTWLAPEPGQRWIDVGCGNGAFSELLAARCSPSEIVGIDPSEAQLRYARDRHLAKLARFETGDAMALPHPDNSFDAAIMALVIFFVPEPGRGVAEMTRVVRPGGSISAYAWDMLERGGFPMALMQDELRGMGYQTIMPPRPEASRIEALRKLWIDAGLVEVMTHRITVTRTFDNFEDYWASVEIAIGMRQGTREMSADVTEDLKNRLRQRLTDHPDGQIRLTSRANAVKGKVRH